MSQVVAVTGAGRGIGRAIAMAFANRGSDLVLMGRTEPDLDATAEAAGALGVEALVVPTDVTDESAVAGAAQEAHDRFGRVDVLVNNSGIGGPSGRLWELSREEWDETLAVNVTGVFLTCRAFLPAMIERQAGTVVIIGSISGKRPLWGRTPYTSSKAALIGLTRTLAWEAGSHGIRVNLVSPGFVEGPRIDWVIGAQAEGRGMTEAAVRAEFEAESPLGRLTRAEEVADACVFLASDEAAAITGADLNVNSGVVMYG